MKVTRQNFEKIADRIVQSTYGKGDLSDAVAKTAEEMALQPEAIKSLLHMVNTIASLKHLDESDDRAESFPLAEPAKVLRIVFNTAHAGDEDDSACCDHGGGMGDYGAPPEHAREGDVAGIDVPDAALEACKTASVQELPRYSAQSTRVVGEVKLAAKVNVFRTKRAQAEGEYVELLDSLASDFSRLYGPALAPFEKDAYAIYGVDALEPIMAIRSCLKLPAISEGEIKTAGVHLVRASDKNMVKIARMIELNKIHAALSGAVDKLVGASLVE